MKNRSLAATRRLASTIGPTVLVVAVIAASGQAIALAQVGPAVNQRPAQGPSSLNNLNPYSSGRLAARYSPYPVRDPTADERVAVAGRVYRAVLDEWTQRAVTTPRPGRQAPDLEAQSHLEFIERLGPWSRRWQEAQDNAARTLAARHQAMADHLGRMSALEDGRAFPVTGRATEAPAGPKPARESAEAARFFRPIDEWDIDRIIPVLLHSERPLNPQGVAVTPGEQVEIANRIYHAIVADAVDRYLASRHSGETSLDETAVFDALLAERLGFWSDLWRQTEDAASQDPSWRTRAPGVRSALGPAATARSAGPPGPLATMRSHLERMASLEDGQSFRDAREQAGPRAAGVGAPQLPREFADVARFFRLDAVWELALIKAR